MGYRSYDSVSALAWRRTVPDPFDEEAFEDFLRQFEPRAPSPLPSRPPVRFWWAVAAAALTALGLYVGLRAGSSSPQREVRHDTVRPSIARHRPTFGELSVVLHPRDHARVTAELESDVLADPRRAGGALRALADH
jgi:hypothetical protein